MRFRAIQILLLNTVLVGTLTVGNVFAETPPRFDAYQADVVRIRELFESRKFLEVTALLEDYQSSCEKDIRWEFAVDDAFSVFFISSPTYKELLDEWARALPKSWVPLVARAIHYDALGWKARGGAWAKDTPDEQVKRMEELLIVAAEDAQAALDINPRLCSAYAVLMDVNRSQGNQDVGSLLLQKALTECPESCLIRETHMGLLTPRWGGSHEAMMQFALESASNAKNPDIKRLQGLVYWDMGRTALAAGKIEQAIAYYQKALTFGESYRVLVYLAEAFVDGRTPDKALEVIARAISLRPNRPYAYGLRSKILLSQEKEEEALKELERMKLFGGKDSDEFVKTRRWEGNQVVSRAHALLRMGLLTQAIEKYNLALRFDPESAVAFCWRGRTFHRAGNDGAEDDLRKALSLDPHYIDAYQGLDEVLFKQRRLDEIVELWNRYIELEPGIAKAYLERSGTYYHKKDLVSAYRDLKRACDLGNTEGCTRMRVLKDGPLKDQAAIIDMEFTTANVGSTPPKASGAPAKIKAPSGKWSFRDSQGKLITTEEFDDAWDFNDGYARVKQNGKWGFLDMKGTLAIKPQYDYCWDFSGNKAKVRLENGNTHYIDRSGTQTTE